MAKGSYIKDKKISILTVKETGPYPGDTEEAPIQGGENIWAYYRQSSAEEYNNAVMSNYKVEALFKIGWRDNIDNTMKVVFRGKKYAIARIDDYEGYKKDLTVYAYIHNPK